MRDLDLFIERARIEVIGVNAEQGKEARRAFARYGKGRHKAGLNFGDCFAYALAIERGEPLLFKGNDFGRTNVLVAVPQHVSLGHKHHQRHNRHDTSEHLSRDRSGVRGGCGSQPDDRGRSAGPEKPTAVVKD